MDKNILFKKVLQLLASILELRSNLSALFQLIVVVVWSKFIGCKYLISNDDDNSQSQNETVTQHCGINIFIHFGVQAALASHQSQPVCISITMPI